MDGAALSIASIVVAIALLALAAVLWMRRNGPRATYILPRPEGALCGIVVGSNSYDCDVVGEAKFQGEPESIVGGRSEEGAEYRCNAVLRREPENPHDPNAVRVEIDGHCVGYLRRAAAKEFSQEINVLGYQLAVCKAVIVGGWTATKRQEAGHFGVRLDADRPFEFDEPPRA